MSRIALVDGVSFVRQCIASTIRNENNEVEEFEAADTVDGKFDLILYHSDTLDSAMIDDLTQLKEHGTIVVISSVADASTVRRAVELGVRGYLPASMDIEEVRNVLHFVLSGGMYIPQDVLMLGYGNMPDRNALTEREVLILNLMRNGKQNKVIAYELGLSESTVKVHIRHILTKLGVRNRTEAVSVSFKPGFKPNGAAVTPTPVPLEA